MLRRALVALSLANLCFIPAWREVLDPGPLFHCYHTKLCPVGAELAGVTLDALLLAALFFLGFGLARRVEHPLGRKVAYAAFLLALLFPLNGLRIQSTRLMTPQLISTLGPAGFALLALALLALALFAVWRVGLARLARGAATAVLILSPFLAIAYAQSLWKMLKYQRGLADQAAAARPSTPAATPARVVWLIFDELDYRAAFDERPASLRLPEFDRLRGEALFATEAYPPSGSTLQSIPALVSGKLVADARQTRPDDLAVRFHEEPEFVGWRTRPNIFSRLRESGMAAAVAGYYHPYCRLFGAELARCSWKEDSFTAEGIVRRSRVADNMARDARVSFLSLPLLHRLVPRADEPEEVDPVLLEHTARNYSEIMEDARRISTDTSIHLAYVHLPLPHPPGFYDRAQGRIDVHRKSSYLDNLALADRTLGELRRAMEDAGVWDGAAVIVSSDHWWRARELWSPETGDPTGRVYWHPEDVEMQPPTPEYKVPFILKLPGRAGGTAYAPAFNTVVSHDLVLALLRGEVQSAESAAAFLDRHRSIGVSPYNNVLLDLIQIQKAAGRIP
jgi:Sulfatase